MKTIPEHVLVLPLCVACILHKGANFFVEGPEYYCNVNSQYYPFENAYFHHCWVCKKSIF